MFRITLPSVVLAAALASCATMQPPLTLVASPAPVSFNGHVAGQFTDMVFTLVPDPNPAAPGLAMQAGETLNLALPASFTRNLAVPLSADTDVNLVLTKGWPQGAVPLVQQYRVGFDERAHAITVTALKDIRAEGANAPGIKVIHLRGRTFVNPAAGDYPATVSHLGVHGQALVRWQGQLQVQGQAPAARLAPSNFHLPPGTNADFQRVATGQVAPRMLGLILWGSQGSALNAVGIAPRDLVRYPRFTGGLLVQDSNHDRRLDPANDTVVGGIIGAAPQGATGQSASSPMRSDGTPVLSGEVLRDAAYPAAAGGGKPNPGLLAIQFRTGDKPGLYRPTVELIGGNSYRFAIEAISH